MSKLLRGLLAFYALNMAEDSGGAPASEPTDDVSSPAQAMESDVQWDLLSDESTRETGMGEAPEEVPPQTAAANEASKEEAPTPPAPPTDETPPAPATEEAAQTPEAAVEPPAALTPEQQAELQRQWQEYQAKQQEQLEQYYAIDEESALALATEPEKVLPKLAAQLHMSVMQQVQAEIAQSIPTLLKGTQEREVRESKAKNEFFTAWPELKGKENEVMQMGLMFRQLNPKATPQEAIQRIGEMTMNALGIARQQQQQQQQQQRPAAPATPFRPAGGPSAVRPAGTQSKNAWEDLLDE